MNFGSAVCTSANGTIFAVGSDGVGSDGYPSRRGDISIYKFNPIIQSYEKFGLTFNGAAKADEFGSSITMSADGSIIVVGARMGDLNNTYEAGYIRVYKFNRVKNAYYQFGPDMYGNDDDNLGASVSMSADGSTFVVGAWDYARVYQLNKIIKTYVQLGSDIKVKTPTYGIRGRSVSMSADGSTFLVDSQYEDTYGFVNIFKFNPLINAYEGVGQIRGTYIGTSYGERTSISGDGSSFVVGSNNVVRVYKLNKVLNEYEQFGSDIQAVVAEYDSTVYMKVSMSKDGSTFVVGAHRSYSPLPGRYGRGYVRVYKLNKLLNVYKQVQNDIFGEVALDAFGYSVSMSANGLTFVVGAPFHDGNRTASGKKRVNVGQVRVYQVKKTE
jgi:hypothetical protein